MRATANFEPDPILWLSALLMCIVPLHPPSHGSLTCKPLSPPLKDTWSQPGFQWWGRMSSVCRKWAHNGFFYPDPSSSEPLYFIYEESPLVSYHFTVALLFVVQEIQQKAAEFDAGGEERRQFLSLLIWVFFTSFQKWKTVLQWVIHSSCVWAFQLLILPSGRRGKHFQTQQDLKKQMCAAAPKLFLTLASSDAFPFPATVLLSMHAALQRCVLLPHTKVIHEFAQTSLPWTSCL